jgi:hypothetical protein
VGHGKLRCIGTSLALWTNKLSISCNDKDRTFQQSFLLDSLFSNTHACKHILQQACKDEYNHALRHICKYACKLMNVHREYYIAIVCLITYI